jgi:hypothetical protein
MPDPVLKTSSEGSVDHARDAPPALEIHAALARDRGKKPTSDRPTEKRCRIRRLSEAILVDLDPIDGDPRELLILETAAIEQEAHPTGAAGTRPQEIDAGEPATLDLQMALLECLALARLPGRLTGFLDLTARYRPASLVGGPQDQQSPGFVEDQRTR